MSNETYDKVIQLFKDIDSVYPGQPMTKHDAIDFYVDLDNIALDYNIEYNILCDFVDWLECNDIDDIEEALDNNETIIAITAQLEEPIRDMDFEP